MADGRHFENRYSPYLSEKSSDFDEILYTAADFELDERHVIKNDEVALDRLRVRQNVFLVNFFNSFTLKFLKFEFLFHANMRICSKTCVFILPLDETE